VAPWFTIIGSITEADVRRWRADLLDEGVSPVTTAKAYRLLKSILATAVEDSLIRRNPCRVKGAGTEQSPERPLLTVAEVYSLAEACGPRYRAMILLACFGGCAGASSSRSAAVTSTPQHQPSASAASSPKLAARHRSSRRPKPPQAGAA
jgi:hypothetical protein